MKTYIKIAALLCLGLTQIKAQCPLPTGYNFENFTSAASFSPCTTGWTTNISGTFTYGSGQAGISGKFDQQGEYIQFYSADPIGTVSYYLKGFNTGGAWSGTFKLQESINGSTWTDLTTFANTLSSTAFTNYTVTPA